MSYKPSYICGRHPVLEALSASVPADKLFFSENIKRDKLIDEIVTLARSRKIDIDSMPEQKFSKKFFDDRHPHQGVALQVSPFEYASVDDVLAHAHSEYKEHECAIVIICDHITDAGNLGAIARSAESVGAAGIIIPNKRSVSVTPATHKTSAGAIAHLPVAMTSNINQTLEQLKDGGFWVVGATEYAEDFVWDTDLQGRIALVVGNENSGISDLVKKNCDMLAKLPQLGEISSLNVAQAATTFMYEWVRQNIDSLVKS